MANGTIAFDTLSTSGQITGTAKSLDTDYVVNGSAKAWVHAVEDAVTGDDLNITDSTDNGDGDYTFNFTSNMGNTLFAVTATTNADSHTNMYNWARTTSSYNVAIRDASNTFHNKNHGSVVHGDLA